MLQKNTRFGHTHRLTSGRCCTNVDLIAQLQGRATSPHPPCIQRIARDTGLTLNVPSIDQPFSIPTRRPPFLPTKPTLANHPHVPEEQASWSRLCEDGGRPSVGRHIGRVVRSTVSQESPATAMMLGNTQPSFFGDADQQQQQQQQQRQGLTWEDQYPRPKYRGDLFKPPLFDDEPSDSDDDESQQASSLAAARK